MFTQERMWLRKIWYRMVLITMYFNAGLIPWYLTMRNLGLVNNFFAYIIPALVSPFNMILVKTYIESTPKELQESAEIDGANIITVFFRIILPIITPILATIAIFSAVGQWNSFYDTLILMTEQKLYTLQFVLYIYMNQATLLANQIRSGIGMTESMMNAATRQTEMSVRLTLTIIVIMPILFVYPIFQRFFVQGLMIGAIKG
jgi:multiple sugar transport system permease protein/putative aldouronate transport system permease protein